MGSQDEQTVDIANSIVNGSLQNVANYCSITCNDNISNLDVVLVGGNDTVNINQSCSIIGAECLVKNVINSQIDNLVNDVIKQSSSNMGIFSLLGPSSSETANITNALKNQVSQIITNTCYISSDNSISNVGVFVQDANFNLNIAQTGSVNKSECVLDTVAKILINNSIQNDVKQTESSCGNILGILIVVIVILILFFLYPLLSTFSQAAADVISPN